MSVFKIGDVVALTAGSMRMAVEAIDGDNVSTVWCHEGLIGRDTFAAVLLKKWENREGGGDRGGKRFDDKPKGKPGWDGKPREKKYFRKD
jgi:hypothetical protein